LNNYCSLADVI